MAAEHDLADEPLPAFPMSQFGKGARLIREVAKTGRPAVVTEDGVEVAVIVDIAAYHDMQRENGSGDLRRTLLAASTEVDAGNVVDDDVVRAHLHARFAGRAPPALLEELVSPCTDTTRTSLDLLPSRRGRSTHHYPPPPRPLPGAHDP